MGIKKTTSADMISNSGNEIIVKLGGLDWTPTYLSTDTESNTILTLWMTNNEQDLFQDPAVYNYENPTDAKYGFVKGTETGRWGLYSDWSADWTSSTTKDGVAEFYPNNMYGTSYIRSVTLNNGGKYATSNTTLSADLGQDKNNVFAKFTMKDVVGSLANYIVTPANVSWQKKQSARAEGILGALLDPDYQNDEWDPGTAVGNYYSNAYNYQEHNGYNTWKDDKIWLPSLTETAGLWKVSNNQKKNYDGLTASITISSSEGSLGSNNVNYVTDAYTSSFTRSGGGRSASTASSGGSNGRSCNCSCAVRPALHLNLNFASLSAGIEIPPLTPEDYGAVKFANEDLVGIDGSTAAKAYEISNVDQLESLRIRVNIASFNADWTSKYYKLTEDIYLGDYGTWTPIGTETAKFKGHFDGNGHKIVRLKFDEVDGIRDYQGLFGWTSGADLHDLILEVPYSMFYNSLAGFEQPGGTYKGALVGNAEGGTISNISCRDEYNYTSSFGGGIVGKSSATIENCNVDCNIKGTYCGGIVGEMTGGAIRNCIINCYISYYSGGTNSGGIAGKMSGGDITNCVVRGVLGNPAAAGLIGNKTGGTVSNCCLICSADFDTVAPFVTEGTKMVTACYAVINGNKRYISTELTDPSWTIGWAVVNGMNGGLPIQKGLYWIASATNSTIEDIQRAFAKFEIIT